MNTTPLRGYTIVSLLSQEMLRKMEKPENAAKGNNWREFSFYDLFSMLREEVAELSEQVMFVDSPDCHPSRENLNAIISECADVANFCAMIVDKASAIRSHIEVIEIASQSRIVPA